MTAPPQPQSTSPEPRVEHISAESVTELSTRTAQMRFLTDRLPISRPQAHALIRAYELDLRDAKKAVASARLQSSLDRLMRELPLGNSRARKVQTRVWRVAS